MKIFHTAYNRLATGLLLVLGLLVVNTAFGAGIQIEQVLRDFQARHKLVTGSYIQWLKCSQGSSPAPHFPKDGFYGNLNEDPEEGVRILTNLVERFYTNNAIFTAFVKAPNGYSSIENVSEIINYTMSDMTVVLWSDITPATYAAKLQIVADQVAKLILIKTNASQVIDSSDHRQTTAQTGYDVGSCGSIQSCIVDNHSSTGWGNLVNRNGCASGAPLTPKSLGKIGLHFETFSIALPNPPPDPDSINYFAAGRDTRGKIRADLSGYKTGLAKAYLKLGSVSTSDAILPYVYSQHMFSYSSTFGQNRPTTATEGNYGVWSQGDLGLGAQLSTTGFVTESEAVPSAQGNCPTTGDMTGWQIDDAVAVIQPDFTITPDPQDCCSCIACEAGDLDASVASLHVSIGLGGDGFSGSAGSVTLSADVPSTLLAKPIGLRSSTASTVEVIRDANTNHIQFKTSQRLVNIKTNNAYYYTISVYTNAGSIVDGFYQPVGSAYTTIIVENPDSGSASNRLKFTRTADGGTLVTEYTYSGANDQWEMSTGGGLRKETRSSIWDAAHTNRYETNIVKNSSDVIVYKEVNVYTMFPWGEARTTNLLNPDALPSTGLRKTTWSYYTNSVDTGSYRQLKQEIDANGKWTTYYYDSAGRETNRIEQFLSSDIDSSQNRTTTTIFSTNVPQITINQYVLATNIATQYKVIASGEVRDIRCQTAGAAWDATDNLVTITKNYTNGSFAGELYRIVNPDGTVQLHLYSTNATEKTTVVLSGVPDDGSETNITRGTITTTVNGIGGEIRSRIVKYRMSAGSDFTVDQDTYTYLDPPRNRSYYVVHLDGTTNQYNYACCGLDSEIDRDGNTTTYIYDGLKRQIGSTRNGITTTNLLDANGSVLATVRVGTSGTTITLSTSQYDLAGRLTNSVDALGQTTSIREFIDAVTTAPTRRTTYPDGGLKIETFAKDGALLRVTGGPARNTRYTNWVETSGADAGKLYTHEIKLTTSGAETGEWTKQYFDGAGRVYKTLFADSSYSQSFFNSKGQLSKEVDPGGVTTLYEYNALGELSLTVVDMDRDGQIDWAGTDRITQTTNDVLTSHGTTVRRTRQYVWATDGVNAATLVSTRETSADGLLNWTESFGVTSSTGTKFAGGGVRYVTNSFPAGNYTLSRFENSRLIAVTNSGGAGGTTYGYDVHGRQLTVADVRNGTTSYTFNNADQVSSITTPAPGVGQSAQVTTNYFDVMGRVWKVGLPDNTSVTNEFNGTGDLTKTYGSRTYPVEYQYDSHGRATNMITWTGYPSTGSASTKWKYNERGFITNKVYADGNGPRYTYTAAGRLNTRIWARGITTTYAYNNAGEVSTVNYSDGSPGTTNTYDRRGRLLTVVQGANTNSMVYGDAGQLLSETFNGLTVTNTYDSFLRRNSVSVAGYSSTLTDYGYDTAVRLGSVTNGNYTATYAYHADSSLVNTITFRDGAATRLTTTKSYDNLSRLTQISSTSSSGSAISFGYAYNSANQRTGVTNADSSRWTYSYDGLGQVTSGKRYWSDGTIVAGQQFDYGFDDMGNRKFSGGGGDNYGQNLRYSQYTVNNLNQYTSRTVPGSLHIIGTATNTANVTVNDGPTIRKGDYYSGEALADNAAAAAYQGITNLAVLAQGTNSEIVTNILGSLHVAKAVETLGYDLDGNMISDSLWTNTWDVENRLIATESASGVPSEGRAKQTWSYLPDGRWLDQLTYIWSGGAYVAQSTNRFVWDGRLLLAIVDHTNGLVMSFIRGLDLSGSMEGAGGVGGALGLTITTNSTHFYAYDGNGNIHALVTATSGTVSADYEYDPFGNTLRASGSVAKVNPLQFSSQYSDEVVGILKYYYRDYEPSKGKWKSRDPLGELDPQNLYGFCGNDGVNKLDWLGALTYEQGVVVLALQKILKGNRDSELFRVSGITAAIQQLRTLVPSVDVKIGGVSGRADAQYFVGDRRMRIRNTSPRPGSVMHELVHAHNDINKTGFSTPIRTDEGTAYAADAVVDAIADFGFVLEDYLDNTNDNCDEMRRKLRIRWQERWKKWGDLSQYSVTVRDRGFPMTATDFANLRSALGMGYKCSEIAAVLNKKIKAKCGCFVLGCAEGGKNPNVIPAGYSIHESLR